MKNEVKISIEGLCVGMFVSRLDRPWIQTPFALQGVLIESKQDIESLRKYCNFVFVDMDQGPAPDPRYWILRDDAAPQTYGESTSGREKRARKKQNSDEFTKLRKTTYTDSTQFSAELLTATDVSKRLGQQFDQLITDLKQGRDLDLKIVQAGVSAMVDSIVRNPSAMMWVTQLKKMDEYTYSRALGTSVWCATFGRHLGLDKPAVRLLALGGLLLDLGKSQLPAEILHKKGPLSPEETKLMHSHVDLGIRILASASSKANYGNLPVDALQMVATHHERADGSGYPQNLHNNQIPIYGRMAGIVDSYDAMTSERPYDTAGGLRTPHDAIAELYELRGTKFQAELVEQFIQTVGLYPTGSLIELNTGEVGVVIATNGLRRLRPTFMLLLDENKEPVPEFRHIDLTKLGDEVTVEKGLPAGAYGIDMKELFL